MGVYLDILQVSGVWKHCKYIIFVLRASLSVFISFLSHLKGGRSFRGESPHRVIMLGTESRITVNQICNHFFSDNHLWIETIKKLMTDNIRYLSREVPVTKLLWVAGLQSAILKDLPQVFPSDLVKLFKIIFLYTFCERLLLQNCIHFFQKPSLPKHQGFIFQVFSTFWANTITSYNQTKKN